MDVRVVYILWHLNGVYIAFHNIHNRWTPTCMNLACRTHAVVIILGALLSLPFCIAQSPTHDPNSMENLKIDAKNCNEF